MHLARAGIHLVLLDIEGTTTPIRFVYDVLFPYARTHMSAWVVAHRSSPDAARVTQALAAEHARDVHAGEAVPPWPSEGDAEPAMLAYASWLMDRDRKSPGLKHLQALVWEMGYEAGELRGEVYPDVPPALRRWRQAGLRTAIYSSGHVMAQRRLFESTPYGDLTPLLDGFFDTSVGAKGDAESYRRIARATGDDTRRVLFVSDVSRELAAARDAGCRTALSLRPGNPPQPDPSGDVAIRSFDELE